MSNVMLEHVKKNRQKFIHELKSGDYEQIGGKYHGNDDKCFCALGLCLYKVMDFTDANFFKNGETDISITESLEKRMQMDEDRGVELVFLNDDTALDFKQIADSLVERGFLEKSDYDLSDDYIETMNMEGGNNYKYISLG